MRVIQTAAPCTSQPKGVLRLNRALGINAKNLLAYVPGMPTIARVNNHLLTPTLNSGDITVGSCRGERSLRFTTAGSANTVVLGTPLWPIDATGIDGFTAVLRFRSNATAPTDVNMFGCWTIAAKWLVGFHWDSFYVAVNTGGSLIGKNCSGSPYAVGDFNTLVVTYKRPWTTGDAQMWMNGADLGVTDWFGPSYIDSPLDSGDNTTHLGSEPFTGDVMLAAFFSRSATAAEARALSTNPWQIFEQSIDLPFAAAAGGGGLFVNPLSGRGGGAAIPLVN